MSVSLRCYSTSLGCRRTGWTLSVFSVPLGWRWFLSSRRMRPSLFSSIPVPSSSPPRRNPCGRLRRPSPTSRSCPSVRCWRSPGVSWGVTTRKIWHLSCPKWISGWTTAIWRRGPPCSRASSAFPNPRFRARILSTGPSYAWLKISDGCRHACSFCAIPNIRGGHRSHCKDMIVREARALLDQGVKELNLVAQDLTEWGCDLDGKQDLRTLLDGLLPLPGLERLRLMYLYPAGMTHEMLQVSARGGQAVRTVL